MTNYQDEINFVFKETEQSIILVYLKIPLVIISKFYFIIEFFQYLNHFNFLNRIKGVTLHIIGTLKNFNLSANPFISFHPYCFVLLDFLISPYFVLKFFFLLAMISMKLLDLYHVNYYY